jgi:hypothetical protein
MSEHGWLRVGPVTAPITGLCLDGSEVCADAVLPGPVVLEPGQPVVVSDTRGRPVLREVWDAGVVRAAEGEEITVAYRLGPPGAGARVVTAPSGALLKSLRCLANDGGCAAVAVVAEPFDVAAYDALRAQGWTQQRTHTDQWWDCGQHRFSGHEPLWDERTRVAVRAQGGEVPEVPEVP